MSLLLVLLFLAVGGFAEKASFSDASLRAAVVDHGGFVHPNISIAPSQYGLGLFCRGFVDRQDIVLYLPSEFVVHPDLATKLYPQLWTLPPMETTAALVGAERFFGRRKRSRRTLVQWAMGDFRPNWTSWIELLRISCSQPSSGTPRC